MKILLVTGQGVAELFAHLFHAPGEPLQGADQLRENAGLILQGGVGGLTLMVQGEGMQFQVHPVVQLA